MKTNRIDGKFAELRLDKRAALMPYLPLGYPTIPMSQELIEVAIESGADILELGMPFSDPLADGPVIQGATQVALKNGMNVLLCLHMVRNARANGVKNPLVLMGYYNPILHYGIERFADGAADAGTDGLIVADLPPEEADELGYACKKCGLDLIFLAAPTSTDARLARIASATTGFLYMVSVAGVTGARGTLPVGLDEFVERARRLTTKPLCVGFGISNAETARRAAAIADGIIVGSALVSEIRCADNAAANAGRLIGELKSAIDKARTSG